MINWNTGTRIEELELMLITNKSAIFHNQHDHAKVMELIEKRVELEIEKRNIILN